MSTLWRYDSRNSAFAGLSDESSLSGGPSNHHHSSLRRQAMLKKQRLDHFHRDRRIRKQKEEKLNSILNSRGDPETKPSKPSPKRR